MAPGAVLPAPGPTPGQAPGAGSTSEQVWWSARATLAGSPACGVCCA